MKGVFTSRNPIISALAYWGTQTRLSTTGRNVANMREEFSKDPLKCKTSDINVKKRDIPYQMEENIELLDSLLKIRANEMEPDIVTELNGLIWAVCEQ